VTIKTNQKAKHTLGLARLRQHRQPNNQGLTWWELARTLVKLKVRQKIKHLIVLWRLRFTHWDTFYGEIPLELPSIHLYGEIRYRLLLLARLLRSS
jgi:hypothetical protein